VSTFQVMACVQLETLPAASVAVQVQTRCACSHPPSQRWCSSRSPDRSYRSP